VLEKVCEKEEGDDSAVIVDPTQIETFRGEIFSGCPG